METRFLMLAHGHFQEPHAVGVCNALQILIHFNLA